MIRKFSLPSARLLALALAVAAVPQVTAAETGALLARIKSVGARGAGNVEAAKAWHALAELGPEALPDILTALDDADPTASNWLRSAGESIADRFLEAGKPLPASQFEAFVRERRHSGAARRLAYEWLVRVDATTPSRLLPGMLDDPGQELRRDAVALALSDAQKLLDKGDKPAATTAYRRLLSAARDRDQVEAVAKQLKLLDQPVDLTAQFGFINQWMLLGPFDSTGGAGFARVYPPEQKVDLAATYQGKKDATLHWTEHHTTDVYGLVDLNKAIGKNMGATGYAFAAVNSATERPVQLRAGSNNAIKVFLNGKEIYFREEYHHGLHMDQHVGNGTLKAGRNEVLVKVCQNEQTESWAQNWSFQLRIADFLGGAVPVTLLANQRAASLPGTKEGQR